MWGHKHQDGHETVTETKTVTAPPARTAPTPAPTTPPSSVRAQDAKAKDDARKAVSQLNLCRRDGGSFQGCKGTGIPRNVELADVTANGYMVTAESESGDTFTVTKSTSAITRSCSRPAPADAWRAGPGNGPLPFDDRY